MQRTIRIEQTADEKFYIQELVKDPRPCSSESTVTGRWPFRKTQTTKILRPDIWVRWLDYSQPKAVDWTETARHPFYCARTIDAARDHAKKVLADAIKYPLYHEL